MTVCFLWHQQNKQATSQDNSAYSECGPLGQCLVPSVTDTKKSYDLGIIHTFFHLFNKELVIDDHSLF